MCCHFWKPTSQQIPSRSRVVLSLSSRHPDIREVVHITIAILAKQWNLRSAAHFPHSCLAVTFHLIGFSSLQPRFKTPALSKPSKLLCHASKALGINGLCVIWSKKKNYKMSGGCSHSRTLSFVFISCSHRSSLKSDSRVINGSWLSDSLDSIDLFTAVQQILACSCTGGVEATRVFYIPAGCGRVNRFGCVTSAFSLKPFTRRRASNKERPSESGCAQVHVSVKRIFVCD